MVLIGFVLGVVAVGVGLAMARGSSGAGGKAFGGLVAAVGVLPILYVAVGLAL